MNSTHTDMQELFERETWFGLEGKGRFTARILLVDDEPYICALIKRWLEAEGFTCSCASNTDEALTLLEQNDFELVVSDITMPSRSGMELLAVCRLRFPQVAVIMVTGLSDRQTAVRALELGAYAYIIKPLDENEVFLNVVNALERRRLHLNDRSYQHYLESEVRKRTAEIRRREEEIVLRLVSAVEFRDEGTGSHIRRIGLYSAALAEALGWRGGVLEDIELAAAMHDLGKIGVSDTILLKPGKLTPEEFEVVKRHTKIGADILNGTDVALLKMAREIALHHHEKWDGTGYPHGLTGNAISEAARIVAIADAYDALVQKRVYKPAIPEEEAVAIMARDRGRHFDPEIFEVFLQILPTFRNIRLKYPDQPEQAVPSAS